MTFSLGQAFDPVTGKDWQAFAEKSLKGKPLGKLDRVTRDGITLAPIYSADDAVENRHLGRDATPWQIGQRYDSGDLSALNTAILDDLDGGVNALTLKLLGDRSVPINTVDDLDRALEGVAIEFVPFTLTAGHASVAAAALKIALFQARGLDLSTLDDSLDLDPFYALMTDGRLPSSKEAACEAVTSVARWLKNQGSSLRSYTLDGTAIAEAGGSDADELAMMLAGAASILRDMETGGFTLAEAEKLIGFRLAVGTHLFDGIAKLRAMRLLWQRLLEASGVEAQAVHIEAVGASSQMSDRDPWVNMLRGGSQAMAASLGGADRVTVDCFDARLGQSDALARKVMRNQQLMLQEECNLWRVTDPAAGSWFAENHTDKLAEAAWNRFVEIEQNGGAYEEITSGRLRDVCAANWAKQEQSIARRKTPLTGVSEFPNIDEERPARKPGLTRELNTGAVAVVGGAPNLFDAMIEAAKSGADIAELTASRMVDGMTAPALVSVTLGQDYETLRNVADAAETRPAVFLANLGPVSAHTARATFARNLFAAGGVAAIDEGGFEDAGALAEAYVKSGASIAVICGTDAAYNDMALPVCQALTDAGAKAVWLAGKPGEQAEALSSAGLRGSVSMGVDVIATMRDVHAVLGL